MQNNKKIIIFTYDYPFGNSERTFIQYEILKLSKEFKNIEIINQKSFQKKSIIKSKKNIYFNKDFSKLISVKKIMKTFILKVFFENIFWKEIYFILFKKNFFKKLRMLTIEICLSLILYEYLINNNNKNDSIIFYSFWSNFSLLSFLKLSKVFKNSKFIARALGSDLNGYFKNDDYVPFKKLKFLKLDKLLLLAEYQKQKLSNLNIDNKKIKICPIGVFKQNKPNNLEKNYNIKKPIVFLSCNSLIDIKNNFLMIDFLKKFSLKTNRKVNYIIIGDGKLKKKLLVELNNSISYFNFTHIEYVENLIKFINKNPIDFFLNFSSQEGMPFSVMEVMSCGIPVIASNIKPNEYLVRNNGYLFNIKDFNKSINELIKNINSDLINNKQYLAKSINSLNFINKNLINEQCYKKFSFIINQI